MIFKQKAFSALKQLSSTLCLQNRVCYSTEPGAQMLTMAEVRKRLFEQMSHVGFSKKIEKTPRLPPKRQEELPERTMQDSLVTAMIPLSGDPNIQDQYRAFLGSVRIGRLMEDLDLFSVWAARTFLLYPPHQYAMVVTVFVDEFEFTPFLPRPDHDIRLRGRVTWTGKSSLETEILMEQFAESEWFTITKGFFLMAVRSTQNKAMDVNKLRPTNPEEQRIFEAGERRKHRRSQLSGDRSLLQPPTSEEYAMLHRNFLATVPAGHSPACLHESPRRDGCVWLQETRLSTTTLCHPVDRNMYNSVFGGYIMRLAQELSSSATYLTCKELPILRYISYIAFRRPIELGSLMTMHSLITYTERNFEQLQVCVEVFDPRTSSVTTTNVLHLTYETASFAPVIFPDSYRESLVFLEGRRQFITARDGIKPKDSKRGVPRGEGSTDGGDGSRRQEPPDRGPSPTDSPNHLGRK